MTTRRQTRIWQQADCLFAVVCSLLFSSCSRGSPLAPMTTPTPVAAPAVPAAAAVANWTLTSVLVAVTGPDNCFTQQQQRSGIPRSAVELMTITRTSNGNTLTFDHDIRNAPTDDLRESGTLAGNEFTARAETVPVRFPQCPDGTVLTGTFDASVIGRFSDDSQHITAKELWAYHFSSGDVALMFDWSADRR